MIVLLYPLFTDIGSSSLPLLVGGASQMISAVSLILFVYKRHSTASQADDIDDNQFCDVELEEYTEGTRNALQAGWQMETKNIDMWLHSEQNGTKVLAIFQIVLRSDHFNRLPQSTQSSSTSHTLPQAIVSALHEMRVM